MSPSLAPLLSFQDLRLRRQEIAERHRKHLPPVCRARPRAAGERHRQLRLKGHDRVAQEVTSERERDSKLQTDRDLKKKCKDLVPLVHPAEEEAAF